MSGVTHHQRGSDEIGSQVGRGGRGIMTVRQVLEGKARMGAVTIDPGDTVYNALCLMAEHNIGALVVTREGRPIGVISERDYARKVILIGKTSRETLVSEIMTSPPVTVGPDATVADCMALMTSRFVRHLPVVAGGILVGCVSIGDVVKSIIAEQEDRLGQFQAYIRGEYPA